MQQDGPGSVAQFLHQREGGQWRKKYLEAEPLEFGGTVNFTCHKVGRIRPICLEQKKGEDFVGDSPKGFERERPNQFFFF